MYRPQIEKMDLTHSVMVELELVGQPYVEEKLSHASRIPALELGEIRHPDPFFQLEQDGKQPFTVLIGQIPAHNEHVEHISGTLLHCLVKYIEVFGTPFGYDVPHTVQMLMIMRMAVVAVQRLYIIFSFLRKDHIIFFGEPLQFLGRQDTFEPVSGNISVTVNIYRIPDRKMPPVMGEPQIIARKIFPCPVQARELAEGGIFFGNIVTGVITHIADARLPLCSDLKGQIDIIIRHNVFFLCGNDNFYVFHLSHPDSLNLFGDLYFLCITPGRIIILL